MEIWKDIKGYEDRYQISNYGQVKSLIGKIKILKGGKSGRSKNKKGQYRSLLLTDFRGIKTKHTIHRLVALYFVDNPDGKEVVNHKDGDSLNNIYSNLEWCTQKENVQHAIKMGLHKKRKLTNKQVLEIRSKKLSIKELSIMYKVSYGYIHHILTNRRRNSL